MTAFITNYLPIKEWGRLLTIKSVYWFCDATNCQASQCPLLTPENWSSPISLSQQFDKDKLESEHTKQPIWLSYVPIWTTLFFLLFFKTLAKHLNWLLVLHIKNSKFLQDVAVRDRKIKSGRGCRKGKREEGKGERENAGDRGSI